MEDAAGGDRDQLVVGQQGPVQVDEDDPRWLGRCPSRRYTIQ